MEDMEETGKREEEVGMTGEVCWMLEVVKLTDFLSGHQLSSGD